MFTLLINEGDGTGAQSWDRYYEVLWQEMRKRLKKNSRDASSDSDMTVPQTQSQKLSTFQFSSVQLLSHVRLFETPWTAACQASLSITNSRSLLKLMSVESVMPSKHLILCRPLLLPPSIFPSIRVFWNESFLCTRWPKYFSMAYLSGKILFLWLPILPLQSTPMPEW